MGRVRVPERFWWLKVLAGCACGVAGVIVPIFVLSQVLPLDQSLGDPSLTARTFLVAGVLEIELIGINIALIVSGLRGRTRSWLRRAALAGNLDAIPTAKAPVVESPPDLSVGPFVLTWRATGMTRLSMGLLVSMIVLAEALGILAGVIFLSISTTNDLAAGSDATSNGPLLAVLVAVGIADVILLIFWLRLMPTLFGRPYGVWVSEAGIESRSQLGRRALVRWEEMRLFEVETRAKATAGFRRYRVYGQTKIATWVHNPAQYTQFAPDGLSAGEMALRLDALTALITQRTGLTPRTFAKSLQKDAATVANHTPGGARQKLIVTVAILCVALFTGALGAGAWLLPVTPYTLFNGAVAVPLGLLMLGLLVAAFWYVARGTKAPREIPLFAQSALMANAPTTPDAAYALTIGVGWRARLGLVLVGLPLVPSIVPVLLLFAGLFGGFFQLMRGGLVVPSPNDGLTLTALVTYLLGFYGLVGLGLLYRAVRARGTTIRADALGLSSSRSSAPLPWSNIGSVTQRLRRGQVVAYTVRAKDGRRYITWSARPSARSHLRTPRDALAISPEALAALVLARISEARNP